MPNQDDHVQSNSPAKTLSHLRLSLHETVSIVNYLQTADLPEKSVIGKELLIASLLPEQQSFLDLLVAVDDALMVTLIYLSGFEEINRGGELAQAFLNSPTGWIVDKVRNMSRARSTWNLTKAIALITTPALEGFIISISGHLTEHTATRLKAKYPVEIEGKTPAKMLDSLKRCIKPSTKFTDKWADICGDAFQLDLESETHKALTAMIYARNYGAHHPTNLAEFGFIPLGEDVTGWILATRLVANRLYGSIASGCTLVRAEGLASD